MSDVSSRTPSARTALFCTRSNAQTDSDLSAGRLLRFIEFLREQGWGVSAVVSGHADGGESRARLDRIGVALYLGDEAESRVLIDQGGFDLAVLGTWQVAEQYLARLRASCSGTRILIDAGELHFVGEARRRLAPEMAGGRGRLDGAYAEETIRELNIYAQADCVTTASLKDANLLNELTGDRRLACRVLDSVDVPESTVPFEQRRGILLTGDFEHPSSIEAVRQLRDDILPRIDPALLDRHPVSIVGGNLHRLPGELRTERHGVAMIAQVQPLAAHLEAARVVIAPVLDSTRAQRLILQALASETPTVTTRAGIEELDLEDGIHVFVADTPDDFAARVVTLLSDGETWRSMARHGRDRILRSHDREAGRTAFLHVVDRVMASEPAPRSRVALETPEAAIVIERARLRKFSRLQLLVSKHLPNTACVAVVSRGDDDLLRLEVREARHFPRTPNGLYTGHHPADSPAAMASLEDARAQGVEFLVLPSASFWWLGYYDGWRRHLESNYPLVALELGTGALFDLRPSADAAGYELDPKIYDTDVTRPDCSIEHRPISFSAAGLPDSTNGEPLISVVIPTRNRAPLLRLCLESLAQQTLPRDRYEVVVVSDGSTDATAAVCASFESRLSLRYLWVEHGGISIAKNRGTVGASGWIVFHFDDDDVADPDLLLEHVRAHGVHLENEVAVLGFTGWDRSLQVNEVMRYVTDIGHQLFSYQGLEAGDALDFTHFWGGRTSCKRRLLLDHGLFDPAFRFGSEDIELAYRLSARGLRVVFSRSARQYMIRELTFEQFCERCERQGVSLRIFSRLHPDPVVQRYCGAAGAERRWAAVERLLPLNVDMTHRVEKLYASAPSGPSQGGIRARLWDLYGWCFDAYRLKGFVESDALRAETGRFDRRQVEP